MNGSSRPMWTVEGVVAAPVEQVSEVLFAVRPGSVGDDNALVLSTEGPDERGVVVLEGGPRRFTATMGEPAVAIMTVEVDREHGRIAVEGQFWYRGVYAVEPHERGTRIVYGVYNVARGPIRRLVPLWQFQFPKRMREGLGRLLRTIGDRLGAAAYLIGE